MQKRGGALVQGSSTRWEAHHKLPQGAVIRIVARVFGRTEIYGIAGARAIRAQSGPVASRVEHVDVDLDVRFLLLSQSGGHKRQGRMEAPADCGVSGVLE